MCIEDINMYNFASGYGFTNSTYFRNNCCKGFGRKNYNSMYNKLADI